MSSWAIVKRAWVGTLVGLGISNFSPLRMLLWFVVVPAVFVSSIWIWRGESAAMTEASDIVLYTLAFAGVAFLPLFLWHLWLAPYKILNEKMDAVASTQENAKPIDEEAEQRGKLHVKREALRREMEYLRRCIKARAERGSRRHVNDPDHDFITLKQRHAELIPSDFNELKMEPWIGRIISILTYYDYDEALERIKRAVATKSWKDEKGVW